MSGCVVLVLVVIMMVMTCDGRWNHTPAFKISEWLCHSGLGGDDDEDEL